MKSNMFIKMLILSICSFIFAAEAGQETKEQLELQKKATSRNTKTY